MTESHRIIVNDKSNGIILKEFLISNMNISRRGIIKLKKQMSVKVNGTYQHMNTKLKSGDLIELSWELETSENIEPESMELDIIYEDTNMIVINKPPGIPVHPTKRYFNGTLANGLIHYLITGGYDTKIRPVNRLDKDTSGLVVFAKNSHVQHLLSSDHRLGFEKEYIAIVHGNVKKREGEIAAPIARESNNSIKRTVRQDGDNAVTKFEVLERFEDFSLLKVRILTGRTHQIRVHMSHIGHPLVGDELYGGERKFIERQALHAHKIKMSHPITHETKYFIAVLPQDMKNLLEILRAKPSK